ncbi:MAG: peptidylprolyl isomerase [Bdellovibrionales bacterium]
MISFRKRVAVIAAVAAAVVGLLAWAVMDFIERRGGGAYVKCETTKGPMEFVVMPSWSRRGAERFLQLVDEGFFNDLPLFRCIEGFVCQFGSKPSPQTGASSYLPIPDDPPVDSLRQFKPGFLSFAGNGPNSRSIHAFIALAAVGSLGTQPWETPIGYVTDESMATVRQFSTVYGETQPGGHGPDPRRIEAAGGREYLKQEFPELDYFIRCTRTDH